MLSNYDSLSIDEANDLYSKILAIAERNEDVKSTMEYNRRASAYHAMKNGRYAEAIPYIRRQLSIERSHILRKRMLEMLVEAASAIGDQTNLDIAQKELDAINREINSVDARQKYNELQVKYDVSALRAENAELELENKNGQILATRKIMIFVIVGWVALAVMLVGLFVFLGKIQEDISGYILVCRNACLRTRCHKETKVL